LVCSGAAKELDLCVLLIIEGLLSSHGHTRRAGNSSRVIGAAQQRQQQPQQSFYLVSSIVKININKYRKKVINIEIIINLKCIKFKPLRASSY